MEGRRNQCVPQCERSDLDDIEAGFFFDFPNHGFVQKFTFFNASSGQ